MRESLARARSESATGTSMSSRPWTISAGTRDRRQLAADVVARSSRPARPRSPGAPRPPTSSHEHVGARSASDGGRAWRRRGGGRGGGRASRACRPACRAACGRAPPSSAAAGSRVEVARSRPPPPTPARAARRARGKRSASSAAIEAAHRVADHDDRVELEQVAERGRRRRRSAGSRSAAVGSCERPKPGRSKRDDAPLARRCAGCSRASSASDRRGRGRTAPAAPPPEPTSTTCTRRPSIVTARRWLRHATERQSGRSLHAVVGVGARAPRPGVAGRAERREDAPARWHALATSVFAALAILDRRPHAAVSLPPAVVVGGAPGREPQAGDLPLPDLRAPLPALSEHMLLFPDGDPRRRRHAHTACVLRARAAGRLPLKEDWQAKQPAAAARLLAAPAPARAERAPAAARGGARTTVSAGACTLFESSAPAPSTIAGRPRHYRDVARFRRVADAGGHQQASSR